MVYRRRLSNVGGFKEQCNLIGRKARCQNKSCKRILPKDTKNKHRALSVEIDYKQNIIYAIG